MAVASGENGEGYIRAVKGLDTFTGQIVHSSQYKSGHDFKGTKCSCGRGGDYGLEIICALNNLDANTAATTIKEAFSGGIPDVIDLKNP